MESATSQPRPYRWGKFQGWLGVIGGLFWAVVGVCVFFYPYNEIARSFVDGALSRTEMEPEWRAWKVGQATEDLAAVSGFLFAQVLVTLGTGVGILKKRTFGMVLLLLLILRAAAYASLVAFAFWAGSLPYYYKRRKEFRSP